MTPAAKREAVAHLQVAHGMSERRACGVVDADRKSMRYPLTRADDGELRSRLRELAPVRRRFGYRRLHILLKRDGVVINRNKTQRLYKERLTVRKRKSRRRAVGARAAPPVVALPNQRGSLDFVHDQLASGGRFRGARLQPPRRLTFNPSARYILSNFVWLGEILALKEIAQTPIAEPPSLAGQLAQSDAPVRIIRARRQMSRATRRAIPTSSRAPKILLG